MHNQHATAQFVLSYELLVLLRWLIEHDQEKLRKLITKAYTSGLHKELDALNLQIRDHSQIEQMHESIIDFFNTLEHLLTVTIKEQTHARAQRQNLMPSVDQLDINEYDDATIQHSLEKVTARAENNPQTNAKQLLFEEFLRRWKPHGKSTVN